MPSWNAVHIRFKWLLTCVVFFVLPLMLVSYGLGKTWSTREADSLNQAFDGLEAVLLALRARDDTPEYLEFLLARFSSRASDLAGRENFQSFLQKSFQRLHVRFPGVFRFYVVDREGNLIPPLSEPNTPRRLLKNLYLAQREIRYGKKGRKDLEPQMPILKNFIGQQADAFHLAKNQGFFQVSDNDRGRHFFFFIDQNIGLFAHLNQNPDWKSLPIKDSLARFQRSRQKFSVEAGFYDFRSPLPADSDLQKAIFEHTNSNKTRIVAGNKLFSFVPFSSTSLMWAGKTRSQTAFFFWSRMAFLAVSLTIVSLLIIFSHQIMVRGIEFVFPIRWRLVLLFGFAGGLPVIAIILAGWDYANQTFKNRVRESYDEAERSLKTFDAQFSRVQGMIESRFNTLLPKCHYDTSMEKRHTNSMFEKLQKEFPTAQIRLFDEKGTAVWGKIEGGLGTLVGKLVPKFLNKYNREEPPINTIDTSGLFLESLGIMDPLSDLARNMGTLQNLVFGDKENRVYIDPIRNAQGRGTHLALIVWSKVILERFYIEQALPRTQKKLKDLIFFAACPVRGYYNPEKYGSNNGLARFIKNIQLRQGTTFGRLRLFGRNYLLTGIKPKELTNHYLVAMECDEGIKAEIWLLQQRLGLFSFLSAAITIFLGFLLSERFLRPIADLTGGIHAIKERDFEKRVTIHTRDELGEMSLLMNHVLEGMGDLQVARIVQESLFPQVLLDVGTYRIFGRSRAMTDIGGDYFDYFLTGENQLYGLVGDVSGHGVSAALIMGMAKCAIRMQQAPGKSLTDILTNFNVFLLSTVKKKKMMSMFLFSLDHEKHLFSFSNAGQNFPFLCKAAEGKVRELELASVPLGVRARAKYERKDEILDPGDTILLYTDGYVEAYAKSSQNQLGYEAAKHWFEDVATEDPVTVVEKLFKRLDVFTGGDEPTDDISLICLKRLS